MRVTRRELLNTVAWGAVRPRVAGAQVETDATTRQLQADLVRHAAFGDKFSGGPGDTATAEWVADRLRASGYRVEESAFDAPYFVKRAARLTGGPASAHVVPQAPPLPPRPPPVLRKRAAPPAGGAGSRRRHPAGARRPAGGGRRRPPARPGRPGRDDGRL